MQRARTAQDKDLRRNHLLQAAAHLFADTDFDGVTIAHIAQRAGVAKGTAYLYFSCKEAVFLELLQTELLEWEAALGGALGSSFVGAEQAAAQGPCAAALASSTSHAIARTLAQRPTLCRLLVLLHTVIEPRLDFASAQAFKLFLRDLVARLSGHITRHLGGLSAGQGASLVLQIHALVISITQLASPPPVIASVLESDASLQSMRIAFEPFFAATLQSLLLGTLLQHAAALIGNTVAIPE